MSPLTGTCHRLTGKLVHRAVTEQEMTPNIRTFGLQSFACDDGDNKNDRCHLSLSTSHE